MTPTPFGIAFSEPYQSEDQTIRTGTGTDEFWFAWRAGRDHIKAQGFKVRKENNVWLVDWAIPETPEGPAYPPANPVLPLQNRLGLLAYQVPHAERLVAAMRRYGYALDASDAGCHARGTSILMASGRTRLVESLELGDAVMGWDGLPKRIYGLCKGREPMAKIIPVKGDPFVVNRSHILTLVQTNVHRSRGLFKTNGRVIDVKVSDYLLWSSEKKNNHKLFRVPALHWAERDLFMDPYHLGLFIGDGCYVNQSALSITKPDPEILEACKVIADDYGCALVTRMRSDNNPCHYFRNADALWARLRVLGLAGLKSPERFIPHEYKVGSLAQRLEMLAGLMDTDGHLASGGYDYISASKRLSKDVTFLARSVGLAAYMKPSEKYCQTGAGGIYWRVSISGDVGKIPCRIARKKAGPRLQKKDALRTGFRVELLPEDDFYGFSLEGDGRFCLGDFTVTHNTGKTYVAFAVARELGLTPAIVCPKSVIPAWERVGAFFGIRPYFVMNWEGCKSAKFAHGTLDQRTDDYFWKLGRTKVLLVADEAHKAKGEYTQNAKMIIAAARQKIPTLVLSATVASNPRDMRALGYLLGLHDLQNFRGWSQALGCYQMEYNGQARGWGCSDPVAAMGEIHRHLFPAKGSRMRIADLGDAFPDTQITADLYPISKTKLQNEAYHELLEAIEKLKREKKAGWAAAAMVLNLRYRQQAETLKVDLLTQLTKDYLESGLSVVIFVNFTKTLHELKDEFPGAAVIHGQQSSNERQNEIDRFQSDSTRVIFANIMAGGVGVSLHDLHGNHPRVALICPTYSAKDLKQALGRVHRANGKSKSLQRIIYAASTVEEGVCRTVAKRLEAISSLNDGDLYEKDLLGVLETPPVVEDDE